MQVSKVLLISSCLAFCSGAVLSYLAFGSSRGESKGNEKPSLQVISDKTKLSSGNTPDVKPSGSLPLTNSDAAKRSVTFTKDWGGLPSTAFFGLPFNILLPGRLSIDPNRSAIIGVTAERAKRVNVILEKLEAKVHAYESKAVQKRKTEDGEFYFLPASPLLRTELNDATEAIRGEFSDNPPSG